MSTGRCRGGGRGNFKDVPWMGTGAHRILVRAGEGGWMQRLPKVTPIIPIPLYCPMYRQYSSTRVLTLQYLPGVKITDRERLVGAGVDLDLVARYGCGCGSGPGPCGQVGMDTGKKDTRTG